MAVKKEVIVMAEADRSSGKTPAPKPPVSQERLSQKSGAENSFGGYTKVKNTDGSFIMKKTTWIHEMGLVLYLVSHSYNFCSYYMVYDLVG